MAGGATMLGVMRALARSASVKVIAVVPPLKHGRRQAQKPATFKPHVGKTIEV